MSIFLEEFEFAKSQVSDINEHVETLYELALECDHVTEMGVRQGKSTRAFLHASPKKLISYDLVKEDSVTELFTKAKENGADYSYEEADTENLTIEETDLLFIDTSHTYKQLQIELDLHGSKSRKYIILHDTVTYGGTDEPGQRYSGQGEKSGLTPAIDEFIEENPHWEVFINKTNNNGLTVLKRT